MLRAAAERRLGVFTSADARRAGYAEPEIRRLCAAGSRLDIRVVRLAAADLGGSWHRSEARLRDLLATPGPADRRFSVTVRERGLRRTG